MKKLLIAAALLMAFSAPASAQGWYTDFAAAYEFLQDAQLKDPAIPGSKGSLAGHDGFAVTGAFGYAFENGIRTEAELGYRRNSLDHISGGGYGNVFSGDVDGDVSAVSGMANIIYDYKTAGSIIPYVGGGIGAADVNVNSDQLHVDASDLVFAYQFMGGVRFPLTKMVSLRAGYRFFATLDPKIRGTEGEYFTHNIEIGFTFGF